MASEQASGLALPSIQVFEARFGDKDGAIALLECPSQMREFFLHLSYKADLPDSAPAGTTWAPFVRGWPQDDYYLFALTTADHVAVRPGMIATRMIAVALSAAEQWYDIGSIFKHLHETHRDYTPEFTISESSPSQPSTVPKNILACIVHHLIHEKKPTAILGQGTYEPIIEALWLDLPPQLRRILAFGFSFTPADLNTTKFNIVGVPESCESRWNGYTCKCDEKWSQETSEETAVLLNREHSETFFKFLQSFGLTCSSFSEFGRYVRLWNYWKQRDGGNLDILLALLRSLGTWLPDPKQAELPKEEVMRIAGRLLQNATYEGILALRSIRAPSFASNASLIERAVADWIKSRIHPFQSGDADGITRIILALPLSQSAEWQMWVRKGLKAALVIFDERAMQIIWSIWQTNESTFVETSAQIPDTFEAENALIQGFPKKLPAKLLPPLEEWSRERGWLCLMAKAAHSLRGFAEAIKLVLCQKQCQSKTKAIELLSSSATPSEVWNSVFVYDDPALVQCAVSAAKREPLLWTVTVHDINRWLMLLEVAAQAEPEFLLSADATLITGKLYESWENGAPVTEAICAALNKANRLDFHRYPNRKSLWAKLPKRFKAVALTNTLSSWLKEYYAHPSTRPELERELVEILFSPSNNDFAFPRHSPNLATNGVELIEKFGSEFNCETWLATLAASKSTMPQAIAKRVGELACKRRWVAIAKLAKSLDEKHARHDFRAIWETYYDSLGALEKIAFTILPAQLHRSPIAPITTYSKVMNAVFFTALSKEFSAVRAHLSNRSELIENGTIYELGKFGTDEAECSVAVVQTGMGNSNSAAATERALSFFKPDFAFFVGIAGGLHADLKIGDVVFASKIYGYESGKSGTSFHARPEAQPASHEAEQRAHAVQRGDIWHARIKSAVQNAPNAFVKPIAAGEKVLVSESSEDLKRLRATYTDAYAAAMEEHGFVTSIRAHPSTCFAVVRGISDLIENKQEADKSGSQELASENAAAFAFEMLAGLMKGRIK